LIELATFFGSEEVIAECKKLNYDLKLPADISKVEFDTIQIMYLVTNLDKATMM
jgi:hypothetical protein